MRRTVFDTPVVTQLLRGIARLMLKMAGWKVEGKTPCSRRFVLIGAPHTSNWDFVLFMCVALLYKTKMFWLGKSSIFKGPAGPIMRWMGGIPVTRNNKSNNLVNQAVAAFNSHNQFVLCVAPEGTRSHVNEWKSGFWHIASQAKVPVVPAFVDGENKITGLKPAYRLTGDQEKDIANLQAVYSGLRGLNPSRQPTPVNQDSSETK